MGLLVRSIPPERNEALAKLVGEDALGIAREEMVAEGDRLGALRDRLWRGVSRLGGVLLNGHRESRIPGILNVSFEGVEGESLLFALRELAAPAPGRTVSLYRRAGTDDTAAHALAGTLTDLLPDVVDPL